MLSFVKLSVSQDMYLIFQVWIGTFPFKSCLVTVRHDVYISGSSKFRAWSIQSSQRCLALCFSLLHNLSKRNTPQACQRLFPIQTADNTNSVYARNSHCNQEDNRSEKGDNTDLDIKNVASSSNEYAPTQPPNSYVNPRSNTKHLSSAKIILSHILTILMLATWLECVGSTSTKYTLLVF
jgi:hypothetical protein